MSTDEKAAIACLPVTWNATAPLHGVHIVACGDCFQAVWISNSVYPRVKSGEIRVVCLECLPTVLAENTEEVVARIHPDQIDELADAGVLPQAMDAIDYFNRHYGDR